MYAKNVGICESSHPHQGQWLLLTDILMFRATQGIIMDWKPETTLIFAVGILTWENSDVWPSFPEAIPGRFDQKLVDFFRAQGVPEAQIVYLQDAKATLAEIQSTLPEFLANHSDEDYLLIFYFAGHGDWDKETGEHYFINYDADGDDRDNYWSVTSIFGDIEDNFKGSKALLLADCCFSGGLIDQVKEGDDLEISYACISSAYTHNFSTGNWTFTEALYQGLLGDPVVDLDGDREITLYDFARYAELEMAFIESQKSMFVTTKDFDPQMVLAIVSDDIPAIEGKRVEVEYENEWYKAKTLEREGDQVLIKYVEDDEEPAWVTNDQIRPYQPELFAIGEKVEVESEEEWCSATVLKAWYGLHLISYDDYDESYNEWVGSDRIRPQQ